MIIDCPECNKKFDIDQNLIPSNGRLLQCGTCNYKWFFKVNIVEKKTEKEIEILQKKVSDNKKQTSENLISNSTNVKIDKISSIKKKDKKNINYLNIILVIIISIAALIIFLDTFKNPLTSLFPNINFLLDNLYQSIEDVKLFIIDLIQ
tara:strand:- start:375 stop:821 length:447 start_codon:yes stop_codon:yes gene_type:complete